MEIPNNLILTIFGSWGTFIASLGIFFTAFGIFFGVHQFRRGQKWQKAQFLNTLIESFETNQKIRNACEMLDYDIRKIRRKDGFELNFQNKDLLEALVTPNMDTDFTEDQQFIRDCFDTFFDYFCKLSFFLEIGILEFYDLCYFFYWFYLIVIFDKWKGDNKFKKSIDNYIDKYNFLGLQRLLKRFEKLMNKHPEICTKLISKHGNYESF